MQEIRQSLLRFEDTSDWKEMCLYVEKVEIRNYLYVPIDKSNEMCDICFNLKYQQDT